MRKALVLLLLGCAACVEKNPQPALFPPPSEAPPPDTETSPPDPVTVAPPVEVNATPMPMKLVVSPPPLVLTRSITYDPATSTRASDVYSLTVRVSVKGSQGPHQIAAEFVAPGGINYVRKTAAIDGPVDQEKIVNIQLPVAGTMIDQQELTGFWNVKLFHDGDELSTLTFELTP